MLDLFFQFYPPLVRWCIAIQIGEFELADDSGEYEPETVEGPIVFDELELGVSDWQSLAGAYHLRKTQSGYFYARGNHNAVDVSKLTLTTKEGVEFEVSSLVRFIFDYCFDEAAVELEFSATYKGFVFGVPTWNKEPLFPHEWNILSRGPGVE